MSISSTQVSGVMIWLHIECLHKLFLRVVNFFFKCNKIQGKILFKFTGDYGKIQMIEVSSQKRRHTGQCSGFIVSVELACHTLQVLHMGEFFNLGVLMTPLVRVMVEVLFHWYY